jgi:hypothetical protein
MFPPRAKICPVPSLSPPQKADTISRPLNVVQIFHNISQHFWTTVLLYRLSHHYWSSHLFRFRICPVPGLYLNRRRQGLRNICLTTGVLYFSRFTIYDRMFDACTHVCLLIDSAIVRELCIHVLFIKQLIELIKIQIGLDTAHPSISWEQK